MAGNVTAVVTNQALIITGDASANGITIDFNLTNHTFQVIGGTQGGSNTTVNGLDTSVVANAQIFSNVTSIHVALNAGDDSLVIGSATSTSFAVDHGMEIDMPTMLPTMAQKARARVLPETWPPILLDVCQTISWERSSSNCLRILSASLLGSKKVTVQSL